MVLGVNPVVLGLVLAIPRFWDAITDPIVGTISDNTHSRFGRRRPLIILGAVLQAIAFGFIWMVPSGLSQNLHDRLSHGNAASVLHLLFDLLGAADEPHV